MRESKFILQNREKWKKYEEGIQQGNLSADDMERAFVELNDDLAYARTFYKNRAVRLFLNNLLAPVYTRIYGVRKWNLAGFRNFFAHDAPLMNYQARYFILVSFIVVLLGFSIGFFSTRHNPEFAVSVLGEQYVQTTENNISRGDPLAIYKFESPGDMFIHIASNNLIVAFYFFMFGAFFCIGSIYLLLTNGIMLGVFTYMFTSKGLTNEYLLTVYQHGTLEILAMVVEGAAGIMMGAGFLFPGTKGRLRSIQDNAKKSILMFLVCIPIIILAAFIESYLTRFTELPSALRIGVISLSLVFMLGYFIVLPWYKFRNSKEVFGKYDSLEPDKENAAEPGRIYHVGRITLYAFDHLKRHAGKIVLLSFISVTLLYFITTKITGNAIQEDIQFEHRKFEAFNSADGEGMEDVVEFQKSANRLTMFGFYSTSYYFSWKVHPAILFTSFIAIAAMVFLLFYLTRDFISRASGADPPMRRMILAALMVAGFQVLLNMLFGSGWGYAMVIFMPMQIMVAVSYLMQADEGIFSALFRGIGYVFSGFGRFISYSIIAVVLYYFLMTGIMYLVTTMVNLTAQMHGGSRFSPSVLFFYARLNYFILPFFISMVLYMYFLGAASIIEARTGMALQKKIASFTYKKEIYGIETE